MTAATLNAWIKRTRLRGLLATFTVLVVMQLVSHHHGEWLRYSRPAIEQGAYWRLLTGHFVHYDYRHAALNMTGLTMLWILFVADASPRHWAVVTVTSALTISISLWYQHPEIDWYLGLSGVLHGVWAAASLRAVARWRLEAIVSGLLLTSKLLYETYYGALSDPLLGHTLHVVIAAHLYGALGGLVAEVVCRRTRGP